MVCPKCGYAMTAFEAFCPRCARLNERAPAELRNKPTARYTQPTHGATAPCPHCKMSIPEQYVICPYCNMRTVAEAPRAHTGIITLMWVLTAIEAGCIVNQALGIGVLIDIVTVLMAVTLVRSKNETDRMNGWFKVILEAIGFIAGFLQGLGGSAGG